MLIYKDFDPIQTCINPNLGVGVGDNFTTLLAFP